MCYSSVLKRQRMRKCSCLHIRFKQKKNELLFFIHHVYLNGWGNSIWHSSYSFDKSVRCVQFSMTFMFHAKWFRINQMLCNQRPCLMYFRLEKSTVDLIFSARSSHMISVL